MQEFAKCDRLLQPDEQTGDRLRHHRQRLPHWQQAHRRELPSRIIVDDEVFRNPETALDAYAKAWGLAYFLLKTRRKEAAAYLEQLGERGPLSDDSPRQRLADFEAAFGERP